MSKHFQNCNAPICQECNDDNLVWYAGEEVCNKRPLTIWQKKQLVINKSLKKGEFKNGDMPFTCLDLKTRSI